MRPHIETRQLLHLATLARLGNFHRAAEALFITQPALTKSIRKLEEQLGVSLFDRAPDLVRPTEHCQVLIEHAHRVFDELDQASDRLAALSSKPVNRVRVGCGPIIGAWGLQEAISEMHAAYPEVRFSLSFGNAAELAKQLRTRELHVMIADVEVMEADRDVEISPLPREEFVFVCSSEHPLVAKGFVEGEDLLRYKLAFPEPMRRAAGYFTQFLPEGWHLDDFVEHASGLRCENYHLLLELLASTRFLSVGPPSVFQGHIDRGQLATLTARVEQRIESRPGIVRLKDRTLPAAVDIFCEALRQTARRKVEESVAVQAARASSGQERPENSAYP